MTQTRRIVTVFAAALLVLEAPAQAAPVSFAPAADFVGVKMPSESRVKGFTADRFSRGELIDGMDGRVYAKANVNGKNIRIDVYNGLDVPLSVTDDYRDVTVVLKNHERLEFEAKSVTFLKGGPIPAKGSGTIQMGGYQGRKGDIERLVCSFNLEEVKVVLIPSDGAVFSSMAARAAEGTVAKPAPAPAEKPEAMDPVFQIHEVVFTGNSAIRTQELQAVAKPFLDRDVNFRVLKDLVSDVKNYYRKKGYAAAYAYLPKQAVKEGKLEIGIMEGKLENIQVDGNKHFSDAAVKGYFNDVKPGKPVVYDAVEKDLVRLNKNDDIKATAVLKPGKAEGTTDVKVDVKEKFPQHVTVDMNNLGSESTGRNRVGATYRNTNLFGRTDEFTLRGQAGRDSNAITADYNFPVHFFKSRLGGSFTHAVNEVGSGEFRDLGINGDVDLYSAYLLHPFVLEPTHELTGKVGFDWKSAENRILGTVSGKDELRILTLGIDFEEHDAWGETYSPHTVNLGLGLFGASTDADSITATGADARFLIYRGSIVRRQRLTDGLSLYLRETSQWTRDELPPVEQMPIGGAYSVRGFSQSSFLADSGMSGTVELQVQFPFKDNWRLPVTGELLRTAVTGVVFLDAGYGVKKDTLLGDTDGATLYGAGAGFRLHLFDRIYARFEWAKPLDEGRVRGGDGVVSYFGVQADLV